MEEAHQRIIEQAIEVDEDLMAAYLEKGASGLTPQQTMRAFRRALCEAHLVPICFVSARTGAGIPELLHIFATLLPSPLDGNPRTFLKRAGEGDEVVFHGDENPDDPLLPHVFKIESDPFVGKIGVFRVHQGTMRTKSEVYVNDGKKAVRVGHLVKRRGKEQIEVDVVGPGDIGAIAKVDEIHFNATIHASNSESYRLKPLPLPKPMFGLAVELKNHKDEAKFAPATHKLEAEDPCFVMERVAATKQTVLRGMGELHLRIMLERLRHNFGIDVATSPPKIAYKETISARAEGHHRHKKHGRVRRVRRGVPPGGAAAPIIPRVRVRQRDGRRVDPRQFLPAIEKGIRQVLGEGAFAGYRCRACVWRRTTANTTPSTSKEVAFIKAGRRAFIDAVQARPVCCSSRW